MQNGHYRLYGTAPVSATGLGIRLPGPDSEAAKTAFFPFTLPFGEPSSPAGQFHHQQVTWPGADLERTAAGALSDST